MYDLGDVTMYYYKQLKEYLQIFGWGKNGIMVYMHYKHLRKNKGFGLFDQSTLTIHRSFHISI